MSYHRQWPRTRNRRPGLSARSGFRRRRRARDRRRREHRLSEDHWKVVRYLRDEYREHGHTPNFRNMLKGLADILPGCDSKSFLRPLPGRPGQTGRAKVAGLPQPLGRADIEPAHGHAPRLVAPLVQARAGQEPGADRQRDRLHRLARGQPRDQAACARRLRHRCRPGLLRRAARAAGLPARGRRPHRLCAARWRRPHALHARRWCCAPPRSSTRTNPTCSAVRWKTARATPSVCRAVQPAQGHYAEFGWSEAAGPDFAFVRYLRPPPEPLLPEKDRRWVLDR